MKASVHKDSVPGVGINFLGYCQGLPMSQVKLMRDAQFQHAFQCKNLYANLPHASPVHFNISDIGIYPFNVLYFLSRLDF